MNLKAVGQIGDVTVRLKAVEIVLIVAFRGSGLVRGVMGAVLRGWVGFRFVIKVSKLGSIGDGCCLKGVFTGDRG